jgi:hypothetical protein
LVDSNVGYPDYVPLGNTSNNDGLNQIFAIHNVIFYGNVNPSELGEPYGLRTYFNRLTCDGCNVADLISDLLAYEAVMAFAIEALEYGSLANFTGLSLVDEAIGIPNGINENGVAITNDTRLHTNFEDFNLRYHKRTLSPYDNFDFVMICDGDADLFISELANYNSVIQLTSNVFYGEALSVAKQEKLIVRMHSNPFKDKVSKAIN